MRLPDAAKALAACCLASCVTATSYHPRDGDLIFHTSLSSQSEALRRAMDSPYTHMGVIFVLPEGPQVLEAVGPVKWTPLEEWTHRGEEGRYVIKRLREADTRLTPASVARLRQAGAAYLGRPYDLHFEWSDERIYCSELAWKMYREALGIEIGERQTFADFDLDDPVVSRTLRERFGGDVPLEEPVISPAAMFDSDLLITVSER